MSKGTTNDNKILQAIESRELRALSTTDSALALEAGLTPRLGRNAIDRLITRGAIARRSDGNGWRKA